MGNSCSYGAGNQADPETDIIEKRTKKSETQGDVIVESPPIEQDLEDQPRQSLSDLKVALDSNMAQKINDVWCYFCQRSYRSDLEFTFCPKCGDKLLTEEAYTVRKKMTLDDKLKLLQYDQYDSNDSEMTRYNTTLEDTQLQSVLSHHESFQKKAADENLSREDSMNLMADMLMFTKHKLISPRNVQTPSMFSPSLATPSRTSNLKFGTNYPMNTLSPAVSPQIYPMNATSPSTSVLVEPLLVSNESVSLMRTRYKELVGKLKEAGERDIPRPKSKGLMEDILIFTEECMNPNTDNTPKRVNLGMDSEDDDKEMNSEKGTPNCEDGSGSLLHQRNLTVNVSESIQAN